VTRDFELDDWAQAEPEVLGGNVKSSMTQVSPKFTPRGWIFGPGLSPP